MGLPRAGSDTANERYLVPEVTTAPTSASEEYGLMPGIPEPATTNVGTATLGVAGGYRSDQAGTPTILVKATAMGVAPVIDPPPHQEYKILKGRIAPGAKWVYRGGTEHIGTSASIPRFAIKRSDWDATYNNMFTNDEGNDLEYMGIDPNFTAFIGQPNNTPTTISAQPTGGAAGAWAIQGSCPILVAEDGTLRLLILSYTGDSPPDMALQVWWYDPALHRDWQLYYANVNLNAAITGGTATTFAPYDIGACAWQGGLYIVLTGYVTADAQGRFWLFRLSGAAGAATLEAITPADGSGGVTAGQQGWGPALGVSLIATRTGLMLARGLNPTTGPDSISLARSADGLTWDSATARITASTISIASGRYINDSAAGLPAANPGDKVTLLGTAESDGTYIIVARSASQIEVVAGSLDSDPESAGNPITVSITAHALEFLSDYRGRSIELGSGESITAMAFANASEGFAVTDQGRIFYSDDGGASWAEQDTPTTANRNSAQVAIPLRGVYCIAATAGGNAITAVAVGDQHVILTTKNSGGRWAVFWSAYKINGVAVPFYATDLATVATDDTRFSASLDNDYVRPFGDLQFTASVWSRAPELTGWVVGQQGAIGWIRYVEQFPAGDQQETKQQPNNSGDYLCMSRDPSNAASIIVGGEVGVHSANATAGNRNMRFCHITNATTSPVLTPKDLPTIPEGDPAIVAVQYFPDPSGSDALALDADGAVLYWNGTTWTVRSQLPGTGIRATNLQILDTAWTAYMDVIAVGYDDIGGLVWRSADTGVSWVAERVVPRLTSLHYTSTTTGIVAGESIQYTDSWGDDRIYPTLHALSSGAVLLSVTNDTKARLEIYRADTASLPFQLVFATAIPASYATSDVFARFAVDEGGAIYVTVGSGGWASTDDGRTWRDRADGALSLPLGRFELTAAYPSAATRSTVGYAGRLWSSVVGQYIEGQDQLVGIFTARNWSLAATEYYPIWPGVAQWVGIDDVRVVWSGYPSAGDEWTIGPAYRYPARHVIVDSPSVYARTIDNDTDWSLTWDRQATTTTDVIGGGSHWYITSIALFGVNFAIASLITSDADYVATTFPTDANDYATQVITSVQEVRLANSVTGGTILCQGADWRPDQWAPGIRTYYVGYNHLAYKILGNTTDTLITDAASLPFGSVYVAIFGDRIGLVLATARPCRWLRLTVPQVNATNQFVYGAYRQIGTAIISRHVEPDTGWRRHVGQIWQPVPYTAIQRTHGGPSSVDTFGRPGQRWRLPYEFAQYWDRDARIAPLLKQLGNPFAIMFQADTALHQSDTVELVRLNEPPQSANVLHDRWNDTWELEEVV